jgi:hypothetical protein
MLWAWMGVGVRVAFVLKGFQDGLDQAELVKSGLVHVCV